MYYFIFPVKYRRVVIDENAEKVIKETYIEISEGYEIYFVEIEIEKDYVHFLTTVYVPI